MNSEIAVSVLCITYNQAPYIRYALDSFLAQKTSFLFEILIHDDASTDGTQEILKSYEERYPSQIRVLYEKENQFKNQASTGGYFRGLMEGMTRGRYIATCEGDDYWIDDSKLQRQFDYMEGHPECVCCGHEVLVLDAANNDEPLHALGYGDAERDLSTEQIISDFSLQTASLFYREGFGSHYLNEWQFRKPIGDFPWLVYLSLQGLIHYFPRCMSVYRFASQGSYSSEQQLAKLVSRYKETVTVHYEINEHTGRKYEQVLRGRAMPYGVTIAQMEGRDNFFRTPQGTWLKKGFSLRQKGRIVAMRLAKKAMSRLGMWKPA